MRHPQLVGVVMILVAIVLGIALVFGLFQWESTTRASRAAFLPTPTPLPASSTALGATQQTPGTAPAPGQANTPELSSQITAGAAVFSNKCNGCHPNANAGVGPALRGTAFSSRYPEDSGLRAMIRQGRNGMPAFPPSSLSDADLDALIAYLRSLK